RAHGVEGLELAVQAHVRRGELLDPYDRRLPDGLEDAFESAQHDLVSHALPGRKRPACRARVHGYCVAAAAAASRQLGRCSVPSAHCPLGVWRTVIVELPDTCRVLLSTRSRPQGLLLLPVNIRSSVTVPLWPVSGFCQLWLLPALASFSTANA